MFTTIYDEDSEDEVKADDRSERWCALLSKIEDREDVEIVFERAVAMLEALVEEQWPIEL